MCPPTHFRKLSTHAHEERALPEPRRRLASCCITTAAAAAALAPVLVLVRRRRLCQTISVFWRTIFYLLHLQGFTVRVLRSRL